MTLVPVRLLRRLSVGRKLLLIFLLDMCAVAYVCGILVHEKFIAIDFARKEVQGNAYLAQLRPALVAAAAGVAGSGDATAAPDGLADLARAAEAGHGAGLGTAALNTDFARALAAYADRPDRAAADEALEAGRKLARRVGNQSNLILDPGLDTYYTMSAVVLRTPDLLADAADLARDEVRTATAHRSADQTERLLLRLEQVRESWRELDADLAEADAAGDPELRATLAVVRADLREAVARDLAIARAYATAYQGPASLASPQAGHAELIATIDRAVEATQVQLDRLLQQRIDGFFRRMALHLGTALGVLTLILSAVYGVASQIANPLRRLAEVAEQVRRTGDYDLRARWRGHDEIARLFRAFNAMLAQLDRQRAREQELAASSRAAQAQSDLVEALPIPLMVTAVPGHQVLHANASARAWLGPSDSDPWHRGLENTVRSRFFQQLADRERVDEFEVHWTGIEGGSWAVLAARRLRFQGQDAVVTSFSPVNHLKQMERHLTLWARIFETSHEGILIIDRQRRVLTANAAFCHGIGYALADLVGLPVKADAQAAGAGAVLSALAPAVTGAASWQGEARLPRQDGSDFPAWILASTVREEATGAVSHHILTTLDISDRKRDEERIRFLAQHDVLTELPNRTLCEERLRLALQQAERRGEKVAVMFLDLDRFKYINDSLGHHVGDLLIRSVARRLSESVRAGDTVCRLGGDEFVLVLGAITDELEAATVIEDRLLPQIRAVHDLDGVALHVTCSAGVAVFPDDGRDIETLMRHADVAMYQAKGQGRDAVHFFSPELNERVQHRMELEAALRTCVERGELQLAFQPRVSARGWELQGVEALLRWQSAELGAVSPGEFIPIAEETRMIVPIGTWVLDEACRQMAQWRREGLPVPQVAINVSALQLREAAFVDTVRDALQRHGLPPGSIELELTESMLMDRADETLERLRAVRALGVQVAIDDFGTGFSNLHYLHRFPLDRLKIDRSFVNTMFEDATHLAVTRAVIALGHTLGLQVVAEGVETEREARELNDSGCDELQGYLISRPLAPERLAQWLRLRAPRVAA